MITFSIMFFLISLSLGVFVLPTARRKALPEKKDQPVLCGDFEEDSRTLMEWREIFRETVIAAEGHIPDALMPLFDDKAALASAENASKVIIENAELQAARIIAAAEIRSAIIRVNKTGRTDTIDEQLREIQGRAFETG